MPLSYRGILWINASTIDSTQARLVRMTLLVQVGQEIHDIKPVLPSTSQLWLLVFDNADDLSLSFDLYFPAGDRGVILITSRNPVRRQYNKSDPRKSGDCQLMILWYCLSKLPMVTRLSQTKFLKMVKRLRRLLDVSRW